MKTFIAIIMAVIALFTSIFDLSPKNDEPFDKETTTEVVSETATESTAQNYYYESFVTELFNLINEYRVENGLKALVLDDAISKLAYIRAKEQEQIVGHTRPDGTRFSTVFKEYGSKWDKCGENIIISSANDAERMFNGWKNSPTHNENMLDEDWNRSGIAVYFAEDGRYCFVQIFASVV